MEIRVHARHVEVPPEVKARVEQKLAQMARLLPPDATANVEFSAERNPRIARGQIAEITIVTRGRVLRTRVGEAAFSEAVTHAIRNLRRDVADWHNRRRTHPHRLSKGGESLFREA